MRRRRRNPDALAIAKVGGVAFGTLGLISIGAFVGIVGEGFNLPCLFGCTLEEFRKAKRDERDSDLKVAAACAAIGGAALYAGGLRAPSSVLRGVAYGAAAGAALALRRALAANAEALAVHEAPAPLAPSSPAALPPQLGPPPLVTLTGNPITTVGGLRYWATLVTHGAANAASRADVIKEATSRGFTQIFATDKRPSDWPLASSGDWYVAAIFSQASGSFERKTGNFLGSVEIREAAVG